VIWNAHVREMTDLDPPDRLRFVEVAFAVESALRTLLAPAKMNLASLGNVVPHLHWHVIPRFSDDTHFPAPVWAAPRRTTPVRELPAGFEAALAEVLARSLGAGIGTPRR
jgi:diadenosine tetraphosphate (Ap4A) HIT family hydrolase